MDTSQDCVNVQGVESTPDSTTSSVHCAIFKLTQNFVRCILTTDCRCRSSSSRLTQTPPIPTLRATHRSNHIEIRFGVLMSLVLAYRIMFI